MKKAKKIYKFDTDKFIQELELEYIRFTAGTLEEKKEKLPLTTRNQVSGLIWNLLVSDKWGKKLSGKRYKDVFDVLTNRLKDEKGKTN